MKVLIDRNIEINAVTHRTVLKPQTVRWGDRDLTVDVAGPQAHSPRPDETFRLEQMPYLARVADLARAGRLRLFTSFELSMERIRQQGRDPGYMGRNLLSGIKMEHVLPPVSRGVAFHGDGTSVGTTKEEQIAFFRSIEDSRFTRIRQLIGDSHIADAFHLWTAEVNKLDALLTMDLRFSNMANEVREKLRSPIAVLTPKSLYNFLGEVLPIS